MDRAERIVHALEAAFPGAVVEVADESAQHAGHAGARPEGETHFFAGVVWDGFSGQGRVARQRRVNEVVATEFEGGLHALRMTLRAPGE